MSRVSGNAESRFIGGCPVHWYTGGNHVAGACVIPTGSARLPGTGREVVGIDAVAIRGVIARSLRGWRSGTEDVDGGLPDPVCGPSRRRGCGRSMGLHRCRLDLRRLSLRCVEVLRRSAPPAQWAAPRTRPAPVSTAGERESGWSGAWQGSPTGLARSADMCWQGCRHTTGGKVHGHVSARFTDMTWQPGAGTITTMTSTGKARTGKAGANDNATHDRPAVDQGGSRAGRSRRGDVRVAQSGRRPDE
jgi:hypothetical protein